MSAFSKLAGQVTKQYMKAGKRNHRKPMSKSKARNIGGAVAYEVGVKKYGKEGMARRAAAGRRKAARA